MNLLHSYKIYCLDSIKYTPHGHEKSFLEKNLSWYSLIRAWLTMALIALAQRIRKNSFSSVKWICNDNNMTYIGDTNCLIDVIANSKQFSFGRSDIDCLVNCFNDWLIIQVDMQYWHGNMILDIGIRDNNKRDCVMATTRPMSNSSTISKSLRQISSGEHKLCNSQENSTENYNSILPTIYITYPWSVLWLHICYVSYPNVHALFSCPLLIYLISYYSSTIYLPQGQHAIYMCPDIIP